MDLDGRTHRWESGGNENREVTKKKELFHEFSNQYYKSNYGELVNNYDHFELVEKKR
jgi:hypothetical protein